jgi:methylase of polypeptide subunit release factors
MVEAVTQHPIPDQSAARTLGRVLRGLGYTEDGLYRLLGDDAYSTERDDAPIAAHRLPSTPLGTAVRLFFLQLPVPHREAVRALGPPGVEALEATALAEVGEEVSLRSRILPIGKLLLASDGFSLEAEDPPDYVATYTPTARVLDSLTPRRSVERALDVGTGSGIHALLAAQHARHVVATDVNDRALAYTQLNAGLSGITNVECRRGSLFEPVAGETFDHVTCNAPYVVSPEQRWAYRDSGFRGDEVSERVVELAAAHLSAGGFAAVQVSWLAGDEKTADERVLTWVEATGCESWILPTMGVDTLAHAAEWNTHLAHDPEALEDAFAEWNVYFDELGMHWVSEGVVILRRDEGDAATVRVDPVEADDVEDASDQVLRAFETRKRLRGLAGDALLDVRLSPAVALRLEEDLEPDNGGSDVVESRIALVEGTKQALGTSSTALEVIASLDDRTPLRDVIARTADELALAEHETTRLRREALRLVRELLELGALELHADS